MVEAARIALASKAAERPAYYKLVSKLTQIPLLVRWERLEQPPGFAIMS
jgi:hypothetical protein